MLKRFEVECELTAEEIATAFWDMDSEDQLKMINSLTKVAPPHLLEAQIEYIFSSAELSDDAKNLVCVAHNAIWP